MTRRLALSLLPALAIKPVHAREGAEWLLGASLPLSGALQAMGQEGLAIMQGQVERLNQSGGIAGRRLRLQVLDDGFEPGRAAANARQLAEAGAVALLNCWGTASCAAMLPVVQQTGIPLVGGISGSGALREQPGRFAFNLRASTHAEVAAMLQQMATLGQHRFAVVYQQDGFGRSSLQSAHAALQQRQARPVAELAIAPGGGDAAAIAQELSRLPTLHGVIVLASGPATVALITEARQRHLGAQFYNLAAQANQAVVQALGPNTKGIVFATLVPSPWRASIAVVKEYQQLLAGLPGAPEPSYLGMEVFLNTRTLFEGLRKSGATPGREALVAGMEQLGELQYGPMTLRFGPGRREASTYVGLALIGQRGQFVD
jgi:ABC-type branched-subunit amino acid transport system substrate-binding protein